MQAALDGDIDMGQRSFQFINHYNFREILVQNPKWLRCDWPAAFCRFVLKISMVPRTASQFSSHNQFLMLFFNCCSESASQPSWDTLPFSKPQKNSTSRSLVTLGGFAAFVKNVFPARRRGWCWDGQNDSLLSPTRRCNHHWSGVRARRACALLARASRCTIKHVKLLGKLHQTPSFVVDGLDKAFSLGRKKLDCLSFRSWDSLCAASLLMVLRNLCVALARAIPSWLKCFTVQL